MDPQMSAVLGVHFQLDSICSKMSNESIWACVDGYLPNNWAGLVRQRLCSMSYLVAMTNSDIH